MQRKKRSGAARRAWSFKRRLEERKGEKTGKVMLRGSERKNGEG